MFTKMDIEAKSIICDHKKPLTKIPSTGPKLFLNNSKEKSEHIVSQNLKILKKAFLHRKVEKRCARAHADWIPSIQMAKVNKVVKGLMAHFGFQDKNGIFMYPEEMLYLAETNRMEISFNGVPLSIQECYDVLLNVPEYNLTKYRVYKKLVQKGYKVIKYSEMLRRKSGKNLEETKEQSNKRVCTSNDDNSDNKKVKLHESDRDKHMRIEVDAFFERLRQNSPRLHVFKDRGNLPPDYYLYMPSNIKRFSWDLELYICESFALDKNISEHPAIYAICSGDNISFFKAGLVNLPAFPA